MAAARPERAAALLAAAAPTRPAPASAAPAARARLSRSRHLAPDACALYILLLVRVQRSQYRNTADFHVIRNEHTSSSVCYQYTLETTVLNGER
ncbi:unnamed protein product [Euphydryas editha]|uniref:Uncharacterized protein n=1 Tax=Euphydryas editha TaxID=104508 RepID=A0AAU9UTL5_EUPED|nr:unnamed protein product [Euphydryas editha]